MKIFRFTCRVKSGRLNEFKFVNSYSKVVRLCRKCHPKVKNVMWMLYKCHTNVAKLANSKKNYTIYVACTDDLKTQRENTTKRADDSRRLLSDGSEDWNCSEGEGKDGQQRETTINDNVHVRLDQRHGDKMPIEQCRALIDRLEPWFVSSFGMFGRKHRLL